MPPNSSDEGSDSDESEIAPHGAPSVPEPPRRRAKDDDELTPEQRAKDLKRLQDIKDRRENERLSRIKKEGWDRFAPLSETNKPPGGKPAPLDESDEDETDDETDSDSD